MDGFCVFFFLRRRRRISRRKKYCVVLVFEMRVRGMRGMRGKLDGFEREGKREGGL